MDKERAKEFIYAPHDEKKIYISKDLQKILDIKRTPQLLWIYAVLETESGDTLCNMDYAYSGEPIIMDRFIHKDFFMEHYWFKEIINL